MKLPAASEGAASSKCSAFFEMQQDKAFMVQITSLAPRRVALCMTDVLRK
jgi:hypothetical protein